MSASTGSAFQALGITSGMAQQCASVGLKTPTPVQTACIPPILEGRDCVACAKTGSGKTAAFALPILKQLAVDPFGVFAVVLTPTRELAIQIADQFRVFGKPIGLKLSVVIGGVDMTAQAIELARNPHVVIATPGRLAAHLDSSAGVSLRRIRALVLDEADRLFEASFAPHLSTILDACNPARQTLLFSATMTPDIVRMQQSARDNVFVFEAESDERTVAELDQRCVFMPAQVRDCYLAYLLREDTPSSAIVFVGSCRQCETIWRTLAKLDINCTALHSELPQRQRLASLAQFRAGQRTVLIATDVASRGLDIPSVELVLNYNVPASPVDYIHRVGRTARAGRGGRSITLVSQYDVDLVHAIEERTGKKMDLMELNETRVLKHLTAVSAARSEAILRMKESDFGERKRARERLHEIADPSLAKAKKRSKK